MRGKTQMRLDDEGPLDMEMGYSNNFRAGEGRFTAAGRRKFRIDSDNCSVDSRPSMPSKDSISFFI
jgi:hypothetical protein